MGRVAANHTVDLTNPVYGAPIIWNARLTTDTRSRVAQTGICFQHQLKRAGWVLSIGGRQDWVDSKNDDYLASALSKMKDDAFTERVVLIDQFDSGLALASPLCGCRPSGRDGG